MAPLAVAAAVPCQIMSCRPFAALPKTATGRPLRPSFVVRAGPGGLNPFGRRAGQQVQQQCGVPIVCLVHSGSSRGWVTHAEHHCMMPHQDAAKKALEEALKGSRDVFKEAEELDAKRAKRESQRGGGGGSAGGGGGSSGGGGGGDGDSGGESYGTCPAQCMLCMILV